jgi:predicted nucleic acid-binding protein
MKIMLDTNVLISALVFGGKTRNVLLKLVGQIIKYMFRIM